LANLKFTGSSYGQKLQAPTNKPQRNEGKFQASTFKPQGPGSAVIWAWVLEFFWGLVVGAWNFHNIFL
jgi:hypothetical protein